MHFPRTARKPENIFQHSLIPVPILSDVPCVPDGRLNIEVGVKSSESNDITSDTVWLKWPHQSADTPPPRAIRLAEPEPNIRFSCISTELFRIYVNHFITDLILGKKGLKNDFGVQGPLYCKDIYLGAGILCMPLSTDYLISKFLTEKVNIVRKYQFVNRNSVQIKSHAQYV